MTVYKKSHNRPLKEVLLQEVLKSPFLKSLTIAVSKESYNRLIVLYKESKNRRLQDIHII